MTDENEIHESICTDRMLLSSITKHIARAAQNEDSSDFVLASIGQSVGADRCSVFRFWDPGKSSMCTNTHEWCADGVKSVIGDLQTCNLADMVDFNANIVSGRDFIFTDINAINAGSREILARHGVKSLIATPLVGSGDVIYGFMGMEFVSAPCEEFSDRIVFNIHQTADILVSCLRLHAREVTLQDVARQEEERQEYDIELENALSALNGDTNSMRPAQMLEILRKRLDSDFCDIVKVVSLEDGGIIPPGHALMRDGTTNEQEWKLGAKVVRALDMRLLSNSIVTFHEGEIAWLKENVHVESSVSGSAGQVKSLHSAGVRQGGRLVGILCVGFVDDRQLTPLQIGFLRRSAFVVMSVLERIATYHELAVALNVANLKSEVVEFMFKHQNFEEIREFLGRQLCDITGAQHLMFSTCDGPRGDWFSADAPECCQHCVKAGGSLGKCLPQDFFPESTTLVFREGEPMPDMNLPPYCPMMSSAVAQLRKGDGWWRLVADYTKPHKRNMAMVANGLYTALEFLAISYDRECREKTIAQMQEHQRYRADLFAYALSKDDLQGLIDLTMRRLLDITECDYITIHSVDGDHRLLSSGGERADCPTRCEQCSFYKLLVPCTEDADHFVELVDAKRQAVAPIPHDCPAKSLEAVIVYREGKPWGNIALHYVGRRRKASESDRYTLTTAANVLSLTLERRAAAVRLTTERDRVVEAEKSKSYFFSAVSHDIRTPLNAIIGFSELLQAGDVPPDEMKQDLDMIASSGKMLLQLVNDVLDLSKMDLGKLEFSLEPSNVCELLREPLPMFMQMAANKGQTFVLDIAEMPILMVDAHRFRQVLFNFVSNAVKYAGPCTICISSVYEDGFFKLTVADNGKGVSPEKAKRLMQPFVQADIKNRTEGSGLGLSICKHLIELAKGTISIDTALGKGFAIHVKVPVDVATAEQVKGRAVATDEVNASDLPKRIFVVDDSPVNRSVMKALLKKIGISDIELAEDGKAALDKLEKDPSFDFVLTDMWMPVMDGAELVKHIREDKRLAQLKVCSITADVEARLTYKAQGFDSFLLKPVTIDKLMTIFKRG